MANGLILRGEVYWVCVDDSVGSEQQTGRPALIISGNKRNEKFATVIVAYMTTGGFGSNSAVSVNYLGRPERVLCDQLRTIDKQRLTRYMGKLSESEMQRVSGGLLITMCLNPDMSIQEDIFERDDKEEVIALKAECEMWKRSYDLAMNQLVEMKVAADISLRMARRIPEPEPVAKPEELPVVAEVEETTVIEETTAEETERVEINTCSAEDLKRCGCSPVVVENIINSRPYLILDELRVVNGVTSVAYGLLKHKLCCVPVKVEEPEQKTEESEVVVEPEVPAEPAKPVVLEKVNINTGTVREIAEHLGINTCYAGHISSHRNKNGKFVDLEELKLVKGLPKNFYDRYAHLCTIGVEEKPPVVEDPAAESVEEPEQQTQGKVNVNTATAEEIFERTGLNIYTARNIVAYRKKNGPFRDIASLTLVNRFGPGCLKAYGDMLSVGEDEDSEEEQESGKVNINTASLRELMAVGFEKRAAALIVNERKKYGRFRSLDDLTAIPEISGKILRKLRDNLEV